MFALCTESIRCDLVTILNLLKMAIVKLRQKAYRNMSTVERGESEVDIFQPSVAKVTRVKRGPKQKPLPQELIEQWAGEGMGSKAIASKLNNELGIKVSYKTIQRLLSGERESVDYFR